MSMPGPMASGGVRLKPKVGSSVVRQPPGISQRQTERADANADQVEEITQRVIKQITGRKVVQTYVPPTGLMIGNTFQTTKSGPRFMVDRAMVDCFLPGSTITVDDIKQYRGIEHVDLARLVDNGFLVPVAEETPAQVRSDQLPGTTDAPQTQNAGPDSPEPQ